MYNEAVGVDAGCTEAIYNLGLTVLMKIGLVAKDMKQYEEALAWFEKLHGILRNSGQVIFQIADM